MRKLTPPFVGSPPTNECYVVDRTLLREPNLWVPGKQPVGSVKVDWSDPLTDGLAVYGDCAIGDYVSGTRPVYYEGGTGTGGFVTDATHGRVLYSNSPAFSASYGAGVYFELPERFYSMLHGTYDFTVLVWVNIFWFYGNSIPLHIPYYTSGASPYYAFGMMSYSSSGNQLRAFHAYSPTQYVSANTTTGSNVWTTDEVWHFYAISKRNAASNNIDFYKDGLLLETGTITNQDVDVAEKLALHVMHTNHDATSNLGVGGSGSVFGIWNRALSSAEIKKLYKDKYRFLAPV